MFLLSQFPKDGYPKIAVTKDPKQNLFRMEVYDPDTDTEFMTFFAYNTWSRIYLPPAYLGDDFFSKWMVSTNSITQIVWWIYTLFSFENEQM